MKGTRIQVSSPLRGVHKQCIVSGTPKPGTVMQLTSTAAVGNIFTYEPYGTTAASGGNGVAADGNRKVIAILLEKDDVAGIYSRSYVDGERGYVYFPLPGEEFNMILQNQSGTADSFSISNELMVDDGTGKLLACDTDAESQPFICLEAVSALTADAWAWVMFTGGGA